MNTIKNKFDDYLGEAKRENPNASWGNLLTGIIMLVLIAVLSVWYFGSNTNLEENILSEIFNVGEEEVVLIQNEGVVLAQEGEGLWHVAQRVCGDPELYNVIAEDNGLSIWSNLVLGQELVVSCSL